jgi:hypothetical protein
MYVHDIQDFDIMIHQGYIYAEIHRSNDIHETYKVMSMIFVLEIPGVDVIYIVWMYLYRYLDTLYMRTGF